MTIKKKDGKYVLVSKDDPKRVLGTHDSKKDAEAQERAIQANKHKKGKK